MSRLSFDTWSDWRHFGGYGFDVDLIRVNVDSLRGFSTTMDIVLLGFGVQLKWHAKECPR